VSKDSQGVECLRLHPCEVIWQVHRPLPAYRSTRILLLLPPIDCPSQLHMLAPRVQLVKAASETTADYL
jgi:hypothetical protein